MRITLFISILLPFITNAQTDNSKSHAQSYVLNGYTFVKFDPKFSFNDYKVMTLYKGSMAKVNIHSTATSKYFRTVIRYFYKEQGVNFAGHYSFVRWGCGSPCKMSAIVDVKTGRVYDGPDAGIGYEFRKNSRMVIVNPPDSNSYFCKDCAGNETEVWIWDEAKRKFKQIDWYKNQLHKK